MFYLTNIAKNFLNTMNKDEINPGNINMCKSSEQKHTEPKHHLEGYEQK